MQKISDIQLELSAEEVQQVLSIALDEDREKALEFIRGNLSKKVEKKLQNR